MKDLTGRLVATAAVSLPLIAVVSLATACTCASADSGKEGKGSGGGCSINDQTHRADPNPHQPHPALPPVDASPVQPKPGKPLPTRQARCNFKFTFTWLNVQGDGVRWRYWVTPGDSGPPNEHQNRPSDTPRWRGSATRFLRNMPCNGVAEAHLDPITPYIAPDDPQATLTVHILNAQTGRTAADVWTNELAGAEARLVP